MIVQFFEGFLKNSEGISKPIAWAESSFGNRVGTDSGIRDLEASEIQDIEEKKLVTSVDLTGVGTEDAIFVIDAIIIRKYFARPEVRGKFDAALYLLVNEAISELSRSVED